MVILSAILDACTSFLRNAFKFSIGIKIEKDMQIEINVYALHRDPDIYEDPLEFRPERFIEPKHPTHAFLPFGGGARLCLGKHLAYNAMRMCLAKLIKCFQFSLAPGFEIIYENNALFMKPECVLVTVKNRIDSIFV